MEGRRLTTRRGGESIKLNMAEQWEGEHGYSPKNHNHDDEYSKLGHTHDGIGDIPAHNHDTVYSKLGHSHDSTYSKLSHNHNSTYSKLSHNHDDTYSKLGHVHDYAASDHNHDDRYSLLNHSHELLDMLPVGTVLWFKSNVTLSDKWTVYTDLIGRYPLGATSNLGSTVEAALPNVTGVVSQAEWYGGFDNGTGAFISTGHKYVDTSDDHTDGVGYSTITFDASQCSSVYKNDYDTVTPPSVNLIPYIKIA